MLTVLTTTQLFSVMEDDRGSSVTSNLFSDQVIKNAAWRSWLINDTWQPERKRSVQTFIHLWTYTVHLSVRPHTHTSSYSSSIFPSSYLHPSLTLGYVCVCVCVCVCELFANDTRAPEVDLFVQMCVLFVSRGWGYSSSDCVDSWGTTYLHAHTHWIDSHWHWFS